MGEREPAGCPSATLPTLQYWRNANGYLSAHVHETDGLPEVHTANAVNTNLGVRMDTKRATTSSPALV